MRLGGGGWRRGFFIVVVAERVLMHFSLRFSDDSRLILAHGLLALRLLLVQGYETLHAGCPLVGRCPLSEQERAFLLDFWVGEAVGAADSEAFQEAFVCEGSLKTGTGVFDEAVENGECTELSVDIAILATSYISPVGWVLD